MSLGYKYILSIGFKLFIKCNKTLVLPEPDGPIINILNGQSLFLFSFLLLTILSRFNILYFL